MSKEISRITNERLEIIMAAWEDRNVEQDITSQMQSDETGGYERVYDTQTGEIYRAEAGWYESTGSDRYKPVTENKMYAEPISGYIELGKRRKTANKEYMTRRETECVR